ncbi:MAG: hypothetical protein AAGB01_06275, partial [Cyanobacteria bacterium P01_F01_bin.42]
MRHPLSPWHWRPQPLNLRSGADIFERLFRHEAIATLLESPAESGPELLPHSRYSICAGAPRTAAGELRLWTPSRGEVFPLLRSLAHTGLTCSPVASEPQTLPFQGGWLGWLG